MSGDALNFRLELAPLGIPTLIIADDPRLVAAAGAAYAHWRAEAPVAEPVIELCLEVGTASSAEGVSLDIRVEGSRLWLTGQGVSGSADAVTRASAATIAPQLVNDRPTFADLLDTLLLFMLTRNGRIPVHASAFMLGDTAVVLAGHSGSGKSTLALSAAQRGYAILSDDMVFVQLEPFAVWGFPRPIHVFPADAPRGEHVTRVRAGKVKAALPLPKAAPKAEQCALVLLDRGTQLSLDPIDPSAAIESLMQLDPGFDLLEQESREALDALAAAGAWQLTLSDDPNEAIDLVTRRLAAA